MKHVIISVYGGVAYVEYASGGVKVEIVDYDNYEGCGSALDKEIMEKVRKAREGGDDGIQLHGEDALRAELSATNQQLELAQEKLTKAHRVRDELDRLIQSLIPTLTA
jgi:hypothetical protein